MAFVATCMDKAMGALMEGVGTAKKGVKKVPDYAPSTEKGQNRLTYLYMTIATVILLVRFTDFDISIVQAISSMCTFMSFVRLASFQFHRPKFFQFHKPKFKLKTLTTVTLGR